MSDPLWLHGLQDARLPCPSPAPGACLNSCPSSQWCHPTISSSVIPSSSCLQSYMYTINMDVKISVYTSSFIPVHPVHPCFQVSGVHAQERNCWITWSCRVWCLIFWGNSILFSRAAVPFCIPSSNVQGSNSSTFLPMLVVQFFFSLNRQYIGCEVVLAWLFCGIFF